MFPLRRSPLAVAVSTALSLALPLTLSAQILQKAPGAPTTLTSAQQDARAIYREMLEINTVDSVGSVTKAAEAVAARFKAAMDEDFGTPEAVSVLFELATEVNKTRSAELAGLLKALGACLGLLQGDPKAFLQGGATLDESTIVKLIAQRAAAKENKDFAEADRIRKELLMQGIALKDSAGGTTWESVQ